MNKMDKAKMDNDSGDLLVSEKDGVLILTMNRPERRNAMSSEMLTGMIAVLDGERTQQKNRAIIITGSGGSFCAGADLDPKTIFEIRPTIDALVQRGVNQAVMLIRDLQVPVIAAVDGAAAGAGFGLALACDFILVSDTAGFHLAFSRIGASPDGGVLPGLVSRIGTGRASAIAMLGESIGAEESVQLGLAHAMHPADTLMKEAEAFAAKLAKGPTVSYGMIKRLVNAAAGPTAEALALEAACQKQAFMSDDFIEGVTAFGEKRAPQFKGK